MPRHVAIVMDGNGRWANRRGLSRHEGHRRGKDSVRAVVDAARELGIPYLTLYAFSSENWGRPTTEVSFLMQLFHRYLITETKRLMKRDIRVVALGDTERLPPRVREALAETVAATRENRTMTVALALSYGGRQDIVNAARSIARKVAQRRDFTGSNRRAAAGARTDYHRASRSRPADSNLGRTANLQFFPLSTRLHRTLFHRHSVARFPRARIPERDRRLPASRAPLRRDLERLRHPAACSELGS